MCQTDSKTSQHTHCEQCRQVSLVRLGGEHVYSMNYLAGPQSICLYIQQCSIADKTLKSASTFCKIPKWHAGNRSTFYCFTFIFPFTVPLFPRPNIYVLEIREVMLGVSNCSSPKATQPIPGESVFKLALSDLAPESVFLASLLYDFPKRHSYHSSKAGALPGIDPQG